MKISIVGAGYVGLPAGVGLASTRHTVVVVDKDKQKVHDINLGDCPIFEKNLPDRLYSLVEDERLKADTDLTEAIQNTDATFVTVGTPTNVAGKQDTNQLESAVKEVGKALKSKDGYHLVVIKSTVLPGTTEKMIDLLEDKSGKKAGEDFGICMNPEFLREGTALNDFEDPDRIVIGEYDEKSGNMLENIYQGFDAPIFRSDLRTAEMIKYASNALLATKVSFINEISNLSDEVGVDVYDVAEAVGMDHRINRKFLNAGCGFGGSCFPKDVKALKRLAEDVGRDPKVLDSVLKRNQEQKTEIVDKLIDKLNKSYDGYDLRIKNRPLEEYKIGVLGLAFKPGTDDVRNSPAIDVLQNLKDKGAQIKAYDPQAVEQMKEEVPGVFYTSCKEEATKDVDAVLILTGWDEFREVSHPVTIEGRNLGAGEGLGWG